MLVLCRFVWVGYYDLPLRRVNIIAQGSALGK